MKLWKFVAIVLLSGGVGSPGAQPWLPPLPPAVDIPIANIPQQGPVWCWAAVAQQIIHARMGAQGTPAQCALVATAYGLDPMGCCNYPSTCQATGTFPQIAFLINRFGGVASSYSLPAGPMEVYRTLQARRPILVHVRSGYATSHVVLVRGMHFVHGPYGMQAFLHVNDPMSYYTQPVPFESIAPIWIDALVVH